MARVSALTNPTALKEIARKDVAIASIGSGEKRCIALTRLSLAGYSLADECPVILMARAGSTSNRYEAGTIGNWCRDPFPLDGLDVSAVLRFRVLVRDSSSPRLVASAENIRLAGDGDSESLLPIESAELGQLLWRLRISEDGPVLQCNETVFPSGASAEAYSPFIALVLPEALRQIMCYLATDTSLLAEGDSPWEPWSNWFENLGLEQSPKSDDDADTSEWIEAATERFCNAFRFADQLQSHLDRESAK